MTDNLSAPRLARSSKAAWQLRPFPPHSTQWPSVAGYFVLGMGRRAA